MKKLYLLLLLGVFFGCFRLTSAQELLFDDILKKYKEHTAYEYSVIGRAKISLAKHFLKKKEREVLSYVDSIIIVDYSKCSKELKEKIEKDLNEGLKSYKLQKDTVKAREGQFDYSRDNEAKTHCIGIISYNKKQCKIQYLKSKVPLEVFDKDKTEKE